MRNVLVIGLLGVLLLTSSFILQKKAEITDEPTIKWYTWEEAMEENKKNPKKIYIDIYTKWCGPCKMMDRQTFSDPEVINYINKHFYPIKFDAEQKEDIQYDGFTFKFIKNGRRGVHYLAYSLLEKKVMYPSSVFLDEKMNRISIVPGYVDAHKFMKLLKFHTEEHYKKVTWERYENVRD